MTNTLRALELTQAIMVHEARLEENRKELESIQTSCEHDWTDPQPAGRFRVKVCRCCCLRMRLVNDVWRDWDETELERELAPWPRESPRTSSELLSRERLAVTIEQLKRRLNGPGHGDSAVDIAWSAVQELEKILAGGGPPDQARAYLMGIGAELGISPMTIQEVESDQDAVRTISKKIAEMREKADR